MALLIAAVVATEIVANVAAPANSDFVSFWGAARMVLSGNPAGAYDVAQLHEMQSASVAFQRGEEMPFPYPPVFILLVLPFGLLPFAAAMGTWIAATFVPYLVTVRRMFPQSGWLAAAFPPVFVNAIIGQNAFITAALFIGGLTLLRSRPFASGLVLGCLILKPQLGLMLPIALLAGRQWRAIAGASLSSAGLLILGLTIFGVDTSRAWIDQMPLYVEIAREGLVGWHKLASVYASARQAGLDSSVALALHGAVAALAGVTVWRVWRSGADPLAKASVLAVATVLASPYIFLYDTVLLIVPFLWLASRGVRPAVLAPLALLPILTVAQTYGFNGPINLNPVVPITLLGLIWRECSVSSERG
jgi:hypothetical protein